MNLFSRMSEILDGEEALKPVPTYWQAWRADRLVKTMERQLSCARRSAFTLIAAERSLARELSHRSRQTNPVLLERLQEEQANALALKHWIKRMLRELREGLEQARCFRVSFQRWHCLRAPARISICREHFWKAYHQLGDLADSVLDEMEQEASARC